MRPQRSTAVAIAAASVALAGDIGLHGDAFATRLRGQHRGLLGQDKVAVDGKDLRSFLREAQHRRATWKRTIRRNPPNPNRRHKHHSNQNNDWSLQIKPLQWATTRNSSILPPVS